MSARVMNVEIEEAPAQPTAGRRAKVTKRAIFAAGAGLLLVACVAGAALWQRQGHGFSAADDTVSARIGGAPQSSFDKVMVALNKEPFDDNRLAVLKTATDTDAFNTTEIASFMKTLSFGSNLIKALQTFAATTSCTNTSSVIDPAASAPILSLFDNFMAASDKAAAAELLAKAIPGTRSTLLTDDQIAELLKFGSAGARNASDFQALLKAVDAKSFSAEKLDVVIQAVRQNPAQFTEAQLRALLAKFPFSGDKKTLLITLEKLIVGLSCAQVARMVKDVSFIDDRLMTLQVLKPNIVDAQNKPDILDAFTFTSEKTRAAAILSDLCGRRPPTNNPVFGVVTGDPVVIVVDKSGSMDTRFTVGGVTYSRDSFCHNELQQVLTSLNPRNRFNVVLFSSGARALFPDAVPATKENVAQAIQWSAGGVGGSTNSLAALSTAYGMPTSPQAIYFLTDGEPDQAPGSIIASIDGMDRGRNIPVNSIAFLLPGNAPGARSFMQSLANKTHGFFRTVESVAKPASLMV